MTQDTILQANGLSKAFPGVQALSDVGLDIVRGQVHAVTGENGAGKSTLMKILAGIEQPDSGEMRLCGRLLRLKGAHDALRRGISIIHQELLPFPDLTVAENVLMGREPTRRFPGWLDRPAMNREAARLLARLGMTLPPTLPMRCLGVAEMQAVEIAKALGYNARVLIMDEPTSALSARETEALLGVIGDLKSRGVAVVYISHKLEEIFRIADVITVLRDGRRVATRPAAELDERSLIALMVGRELAPGGRPAEAPEAGAPALEVRGLTAPGKFRDIGFTVRRGEIVGIAGLMGAGRTELVSAIAGLAPAASGEILVNGRPVRITGPAAAIAAGIALVPEDRKLYGIVPRMTVQHNLTLASLQRCSRGWAIDSGAESRVAAQQIRSFAIRTAGARQPVGELSGGNQQKVVIAKVLLADPGVLLLDEPARGIDIGAKAEVYAIVRRLAGEGKAVVLVSSEMAEILALSDRVLVMRAGEIVAGLATRQTTQEEIAAYAMDAHRR
jgi:inositol transport system ATP-binding protein